MQQVPFRTRFKAWWEGFDSPQSSPSTNNRQTKRPKLQKRCLFPPHIEVQHMLFGEGRAWPLPDDPMDGLFDPVEMPENAHILLLGTETGAPAFALNQGEPQRLTLMEPDAEWCETGLALSRKKVSSERLHFGPVNLDRMELVENTYDLFVSRLLLHHLQDRERFYTKLERAMRRTSQLIMVMYAVASDDLAEEVADRLASPLSPLKYHLQTADTEYRLITESGLRLDIGEDISDTMLATLTERFGKWRDLVDTIQDYDRQPEMLDALLNQVEHWQTRMKLLRDGDLQVIRLQAAKRDNEIA